MEIEVKLNQAAIEAIQRAMQDAALEAMGLLRTEVTTAQVMPFDTGTMQNARTSVVQEVLPDAIHTALVTDTPYARRLYFHPEYNFQTANNANARGRWLRDWMPGGAQEGWLQTAYESALKRRLPK